MEKANTGSADDFIIEEEPDDVKAMKQDYDVEITIDKETYETKAI